MTDRFIQIRRTCDIGIDAENQFESVLKSNGIFSQLGQFIGI
jgi:hypothetical protein